MTYVDLENGQYVPLENGKDRYRADEFCGERYILCMFADEENEIYLCPVAKYALKKRNNNLVRKRPP